MDSSTPPIPPATSSRAENMVKFYIEGASFTIPSKKALLLAKEIAYCLGYELVDVEGHTP